MILKYSIIIFASQLLFLAARTWNVKSISNKNIVQALVSGGVVYLMWLISISIGSITIYKIIHNWEVRYIPVVLSGLAGGLIGTYIGIIKKIKNYDQINDRGTKK